MQSIQRHQPTDTYLVLIRSASARWVHRMVGSTISGNAIHLSLLDRVRDRVRTSSSVHSPRRTRPSSSANSESCCRNVYGLNRSWAWYDISLSRSTLVSSILRSKALFQARAAKQCFFATGSSVVQNEKTMQTIKIDKRSPYLCWFKMSLITWNILLAHYLCAISANLISWRAGAERNHPWWSTESPQTPCLTCAPREQTHRAMTVCEWGCVWVSEN